MRFFLISMLTAGCFGCGSKMELKQAPVSVSGKVSHAGRPFSDTVLVFQPLGDCHVRELQIQRDGTFTGELISGEYAYYVGRPAAPAGAQALRKLSPQYLEANLSRTVIIEPGQQLEIALD